MTVKGYSNLQCYIVGLTHGILVSAIVVVLTLHFGRW